MEAEPEATIPDKKEPEAPTPDKKEHLLMAHYICDAMDKINDSIADGDHDPHSIGREELSSFVLKVAKYQGDIACNFDDEFERTDSIEAMLFIITSGDILLASLNHFNNEQYKMFRASMIAFTCHCVEFRARTRVVKGC